MKSLSKLLVFVFICVLLVGCGEKSGDNSGSKSDSTKEEVKVSMGTLSENKEDEEYYKQFLGKTMIISDVYAYEVEGGFLLQSQGLMNMYPMISCSNMSSLELQDGNSYTIKGDVSDVSTSSYAYDLDNCSIQ